ncbi:hypothetical protein [Tenacibaculum halocynthiae]|uniref:hypothetical protein n=1 Tax=Tenacibaculum halocynthiae TaxID=1254437 RepID=UPI0038936D80
MFKRALLQAIKWNYKFYLGSISTTVMTFFGLKNIFNFTILRSTRYGISILILSFIFRLLYEFILEINHLERKINDRDEKLNEKDKRIDILDNSKSKKDLLSKYNYYGETLIKLKDSFGQINKLKRQENPTSEDITKTLVNLTNKLKHNFEKRANFNYSVSIKVIERDDDGTTNQQSELKTIARDEDSYFDRKDYDGNPQTHSIFENTCFLDIINNISSANKSFYLNNNLVLDKSYKNSSFKNYGNIPKDINVTEIEKYWTLPYKSEVVIPICPFYDKSNERINNLYGFLCIDCNEKNGFHKKYDPGMLIGICDGIYDILEKWYKINNNGNKN